MSILSDLEQSPTALRRLHVLDDKSDWICGSHSVRGYSWPHLACDGEIAGTVDKIYKAETGRYSFLEVRLTLANTLNIFRCTCIFLPLIRCPCPCATWWPRSRCGASGTPRAGSSTTRSAWAAPTPGQPSRGGPRGGWTSTRHAGPTAGGRQGVLTIF